MPSFDYDLRYIKAAAELLENFLLAADIYWPIGARPPAGEPPYPQFSLGGLLLAERRAQAHARDAASQAELAGALDKINRARQSWRVAWENKALAEAHTRISQWRNFLEDYRSKPGDNYDRYPYEVFRRVVIELLMPSGKTLAPVDHEMLNGLDMLLRKLVVTGDFIWEESLEEAFPYQAFWYLYGRLPKQAAGA